jgi:hypothetical protein
LYGYIIDKIITDAYPYGEDNIFMSYYNPEKWMLSGDELVPDIEERLVVNKRAYTINTGVGKSFKPPSGIEFSVVLIETKENIRLIEWEDIRGKLFIDLQSPDYIFRKGHFNNLNVHHNPGGIVIKPPHHMHFPTKKYPKLYRGKTKYAYPLTCQNDYLSALMKFCNDTNIDIHHASIPLMRR